MGKKVNTAYSTKNNPYGEAVQVTSKSGKDVILLNPSQKAAKAADELRSNQKVTNCGHHIKNDGAPLTEVERAFRAGYLTARKDSSRAWKSKQKK